MNYLLIALATIFSSLFSQTQAMDKKGPNDPMNDVIEKMYQNIVCLSTSPTIPSWKGSLISCAPLIFSQAEDKQRWKEWMASLPDNIVDVQYYGPYKKYKGMGLVPFDDEPAPEENCYWITIVNGGTEATLANAGTEGPLWTWNHRLVTESLLKKRCVTPEDKERDKEKAKTVIEKILRILRRVQPDEYYAVSQYYRPDYFHAAKQLLKIEGEYQQKSDKDKKSIATKLFGSERKWLPSNDENDQKTVDFFIKMGFAGQEALDELEAMEALEEFMKSIGMRLGYKELNKDPVGISIEKFTGILGMNFADEYGSGFKYQHLNGKSIEIIPEEEKTINDEEKKFINDFVEFFLKIESSDVFISLLKGLNQENNKSKIWKGLKKLKENENFERLGESKILKKPDLTPDLSIEGPD